MVTIRILCMVALAIIALAQCATLPMLSPKLSVSNLDQVRHETKLIH